MLRVSSWNPEIVWISSPRISRIGLPICICLWNHWKKSPGYLSGVVISCPGTVRDQYRCLNPSRHSRPLRIFHQHVSPGFSLPLNKYPASRQAEIPSFSMLPSLRQNLVYTLMTGFYSYLGLLICDWVRCPLSLRLRQHFPIRMSVPQKQ